MGASLGGHPASRQKEPVRSPYYYKQIAKLKHLKHVSLDLERTKEGHDDRRMRVNILDAVSIRGSAIIQNVSIDKTSN